MLLGLKKYITEAMEDIDGYASSKRLALAFAVLLAGVGYVCHWVYNTGLDHIEHVWDFAKVDLGLIASEHVPRAVASFKSGTPPPNQGNPAP